MKHRREEQKWPPNKELVQLICEPEGEVTKANGNTVVQFRCPHPYCIHSSGRNIIERDYAGGYNGVVSHLKACIGRHDNVESLYNLYKEIKENLQDRTEILNKFRAETIAKMKPNSGEMVQHGGKRRKLGQLLSASERQDVNSSLEHICMIGAKNRHDERRRRQFETTHKDLLEKEHRLPLDAPPVNPFGPPTHPDNNLFVEDLRLYGQHQILPFRETPDAASSMEAWPRQEKKQKRGYLTSKGRKYDDSTWNVEQGDTINTLAFTMARLSQKIPSAADQEFMNGTNLLVDKTEVGLYETEVPQALLQRCWERAVHASSCVAFASKVGVEATESTVSAPSKSQTPSSTVAQQSLYNTVQERAARSKNESMEKLKAVGMGNYFANAVRLYKLKCPVCSRQFDDRAQLARCFFGGMELSTSETGFRGCCWNLIKEKQYLTIESALITHVKTQVTGIMDIIMKAADERLPNRAGRDKLRLFNWYDVLKFVEESLASSQTFADVKREKGVTSALETLEMQSGSTPIFLNPAVLEAVRNRLIDRYADVPY